MKNRILEVLSILILYQVILAAILWRLSTALAYPPITREQGLRAMEVAFEIND